MDSFCKFIGDTKIADKLIDDFAGERLYLTKYAADSVAKVNNKAIRVLLQNYFNQEELEACLKVDLDSLDFECRHYKKNCAVDSRQLGLGF